MLVLLVLSPMFSGDAARTLGIQVPVGKNDGCTLWIMCSCSGPLAPLATTHRMQWRERFQRTLQLWPYMLPLALVYFAEYVLQVKPPSAHDSAHVPAWI